MEGMKTENIDLSLSNLRRPHSLNRPERRPDRPSFWFERMRQMVENTADWPGPPAKIPFCNVDQVSTSHG